MKARRTRYAIILLAVVLSAGQVCGAELPLREVVETLFKAAPASHPDFAGKDLSFLDLSGLDFKQANLAGADLLGADVSGANLSYADLKNAKLDRTRLSRTNFEKADLSGASLYHAVGTLNFETGSDNARIFQARISPGRASWPGLVEPICAELILRMRVWDRRSAAMN
jgi:uncharacterized protein YjbI with pentapeptide repeats